MATKGKRTIWVGPADGADQKPLQIEGIALSAATLPGTLVEVVATGIQTSASAATVFGKQLIVANQDEMRSKTVDDAWTQNETMTAITPRSGEFVNVLVAAGNNITARKTALSSNSDGTLKIAATDGTEEILAYAEEIINVTAAGLVLVTAA